MKASVSLPDKNEYRCSRQCHRQLFLPFLSMHFHAAGCDGHRRVTEGE